MCEKFLLNSFNLSHICVLISEFSCQNILTLISAFNNCEYFHFSLIRRSTLFLPLFSLSHSLVCRLNILIMIIHLSHNSRPFLMLSGASGLFFCFVLNAALLRFLLSFFFTLVAFVLLESKSIAVIFFSLNVNFFFWSNAFACDYLT